MPVSRQLTCHVLDVSRGVPAAGVAVRLSRPDGADVGLVLSTTTNADGRTDGPLLAGDELVPGRYELAFAVGDHFASTASTASTAAGPPEARYLDVVPIHFGVAADVAHLHVALLVTPWSYTTYRGS